MALSKERAYYKAVRQAITALGSGASLKEKLDTIARLVSRSFDTGASIVLLDSTRTRLIHTASWKLPPFYLRKGLLDARTSLAEVAGEAPVFIEDVSTDKRVQYPEIAKKAGIIFYSGRAGLLRRGGLRGHPRLFQGALLDNQPGYQLRRHAGAPGGAGTLRDRNSSG